MPWRIRQAGHADLAAAARMKAQSWVESYTGLLPDDVMIARTGEEAIARTEAAWRRDIDRGAYFWLVVGDDGAVVGVSHACVARDADAPQPLELALIYLLDVAKSSGIADRLLEMAIGDAPAYLWVLSGNARAQSFYRRHGFAPDGTTKSTARPETTEECWVRTTA
jgi:GNAT superfamily N-acetyltransferase